MTKYNKVKIGSENQEQADAFWVSIIFIGATLFLSVKRPTNTQ